MSIAIFISGLLVGSFLLVCVDRLPQGASLLFPRSHCTHCGALLQAAELVPVVSYVWQQGHCRHCQATLSRRYPVAELLTGGVFLACFWEKELTIECGITIMLSCILIVLAWIDYDCRLVFTWQVAGFVFCGAAANLLTETLSLTEMLTGALLYGGMLLTIAVLSEGMGYGDVEVAVGIGLWLGWQLCIVAMLLAFVFGGFSSVLLLLSGKCGRKTCLPFVPFMAVGAISAALYGKSIIRWYTSWLV